MKEEKQKENKRNTENGTKLKIIVCTLIVILISMIAIFGIYTKYQNTMKNKVQGYTYGMDLKGERTIVLTPSKETETKIIDAEGKEVTDAENLTEEELAEKGYTKEEILKNTEEELTIENYEKSKKIIEKRLKQLEVESYNISVDEQNGQITINIPEDSRTDYIINNIIVVGKFEIVDSETQEVLMNNDDIKEAKVMYGQSSAIQNGTNVYLNIVFNKEGTKKFENITNTYKTIEEENKTNEETNTVNENQTEDSTEDNNAEEPKQKKVKMQIDGEEMMTTSFEEAVKTGEMSLVVGTATTNEKTIEEYAKNSSNMATLINNGKMPIEYEGVSQYILSDITKTQLHIIEITIIAIIVLALLVLIIRYKTNGFLSSLGYIGLSAILALIIRYTNVILSLEGIFAIVIILIANYIFQNKLLSKAKKLKQNKEENAVKKAMKETYKDFFIKMIPICIMAITLCFIKWTAISSFGMIMFWGLLLIAVYNPIITLYLLKINNKN